MKNTKLIPMAIAAIAAVCMAFAKQSSSDCNSRMQFVQVNTPWGYYYCPAGEEGVDYICDYAPANSCTWVQSEFGGYRFIPCKGGRYTVIYGGW